MLREVQHQLSLPEHKLVQEVQTRWNSTYLMLERFHEQFEAITTTLCLLGHNDICLAVEEKQKINNALSHLKPFLEATKDISGQEYISSSLIIPLTKLLQQQYRSTLSSDTLASSHSTELNHRFLSIEAAFTTAVTTDLDPRFKKIPFAAQSSIDHTIRRIVQELSSLQPTKQDDSADHDGSDTDSEQPHLQACGLLLTNQLSSKRSSTTDSIIEIRR